MLRIRKAVFFSGDEWKELLPFEIGSGLHEDCDYLLDIDNKLGARIYIDDVELTKDISGLFKWRPSFYAGRVAVDVVIPYEQAAARRYFLDVGPSPAKSGQAAFDEMVADIKAFDTSLLAGVSSASMSFGHSGKPGRYELDILLARLREHGPVFLKTVEVIASSPHRSLAAEVKLFPLSRVRRLHPSTLKDRRLATLTRGYALAGEMLDSLQVNSQTSAPTFDTPANRALLGLVRRFRAAVISMQHSVRERKLCSPPEEQLSRMERRLEDLRKLENRAHRLLLGVLFSELSSGETTAAGLTQIAAQPSYSRAFRIGCRALASGIEGDESADQLHVAPSWGLYETWCFIQVLRIVGAVTQKPGVPATSAAVTAEQCVLFLLDNGAKLEVLFQATFPSLKPSGKRLGWSLSRERRPDIVLIHSGENGHKVFVLDAKWRSGRENVLDAMQSAHIYHDALRIGDSAPERALLLLPSSSAVPELEAGQFIQTHAVGAISNVRADTCDSSELSKHIGDWIFAA